MEDNGINSTEYQYKGKQWMQYRIMLTNVFRVSGNQQKHRSMQDRMKRELHYICKDLRYEQLFTDPNT